MKRKFKKGRLIIDMDDFMGQQFIILNNKVYHYGWFSSWMVFFVHNQIVAKRIYKALPIEK